MEIELKYSFGDSSVKDKILSDDYIKDIIIASSYEAIPMRAVYMDTPSEALRGKSIAFRVRLEGSVYMATLKWGGSAVGGLHNRGELNVPVDESFLARPNMEIFLGSEIYEDLAEATRSESPVPVMDMDFLRKQVKLNTGKSLSILSLDEGEIITPKGSVPICELEIELESGDSEDMLALGEKLASRYGLIPCDVSKYQRGLAALGKL